MPQIRVTLGIGFAQARHEDILDIDEEEWVACKTEDQREDLINDYWKDWSNNYIDGCAELIEQSK